MSDFGSIPGKPAADYRDQYDNRSIRTIRLGTGVDYRGYTITEKRDFGDHGFFIRGHNVKHGYVVTDGGIINEMPGGTWFLTVDEAMKAIDDLITSRDMPRSATGEHPFWALNRFRRNAEERAPEMARVLQKIVSGLDPSKTNPALEDVIAEAWTMLNQIDDNCDMRPRRGPVGGPWTRDGERTAGRFGLPHA
jgi:hypothetical protein